jgi:hypothetical protein
MVSKQKKWIRPRLIVLGRGAPEENILAGCKTSALAGAGSTKTGCAKGPGNSCNNKCSDISTTS